MKKKINIIVANPAGNITIFVKDQFDRSEYQAIAAQLFEMKEYAAEQIAFIKPTYEGVDGKMEMCGLEFCGNASRTFGLITAKTLGKVGHCQSVIDVSGCDEILTVDVDLDKNYTKIKMPLAVSIKSLDSRDLEGISSKKLFNLLLGATIVDLEGIMHVVLKDHEPTDDNFLLIKQYINEKYNPPAMGVMFYDTRTNNLVPVVYVADVDSTYWEGSCGSGSTATAIAFANSLPNGTYSFVLPQPAGTITSTAVKEGGVINSVYIEGVVELSEILTVEIDI